MAGQERLLYGWDAIGGEWVKLQVDVNGYVRVDLSAVNLNDLGDVNAPAPADNDALTWDVATGRWIPEAALPGAHAGSHQNGGADEINVGGLSGQLADDQHVKDAEVLAVAAALVHAARHQSGGADEINVGGLSGQLADDQHVKDAEVLAVAAALVHAARHQNGGADEINVGGLSGQLADDQHVKDAEVDARINLLAVLKALFTTKGDLAVATGASTPVRLGVGADTEVLTADAAVAAGVKWAPPTGVGLAFTELAGGQHHTVTNTDIWEDWDLSAIVPSGTVAVLVAWGALTTKYEVGARKNGTALDRKMDTPDLGGSSPATWAVTLLTECDPNRIIEIYTEFSTIQFDILGYWS